MLVKQNTGGEYTGERAEGPLPREGWLVRGCMWGSFEKSSKESSQQRGRARTVRSIDTPRVGPRLGSPIGGLWRVFFSSAFAGIHTPSVMGDLVLEGGGFGEPPGSSPGLGRGLPRAHCPKGMRTRRGAEGCGSSPLPSFLPQAGQEQRGGEQGPQLLLSPRVLRVQGEEGWREGLGHQQTL